MLFGNLGADPELRTTGNGSSVLKLRLATTESYQDNNKQRQERTEWHSVVVWGKRAEALHRLLTKGSKLFVEGSIRTSTYNDKNGEKRYRTEINATDIILAGGARAEGGSAPRERTPAPRSDDEFADGVYGGSDAMDDMPF
jgi:single-strand DNA-binding protein